MVNWKRFLVMFAAVGIVEAAGLASSPQSWRALDKRVSERCAQVSQLRKVHIQPEKVSFSDSIAIELRMLVGTNVKGRKVSMHCAYNRRTGVAEVQEASR